jgi:predicted lipoprotein with Yx(FWY)xxD motif/mono/diheme cytochrome c family protein
MLLTLGILTYAGASAIGVGHDDLRGPYVVDEAGRSLYVFARDEDGVSSCYEQCADAWPPLLAREASDATVLDGHDVDAQLLSVSERADGTLQVVYAGRPLYYYAGDMDVGDVAGHGIGDVWFLVHPSGAPVGSGGPGDDEKGTNRAEVGSEVNDDDSTPGHDGTSNMAALLARGELIYHRLAQPSCASCHGADGEGISATGLVGSQLARRTQLIVRQILTGGSFMPPFGGQLSDADIAAVATFVRNSWGNDFGPVSEEEVSELR